MVEVIKEPFTIFPAASQVCRCAVHVASLDCSVDAEANWRAHHEAGMMQEVKTLSSVLQGPLSACGSTLAL
jgi:hypothetical protein